MVIAKAKDGGSESRAYIWTVPKTNALVLLINGEALSGRRTTLTSTAARTR